MAGLGISGTTLKFLTQDALAEMTDSPSDEVPRLYGYRIANSRETLTQQPPEREPIYYTIPRDEWIRTETALDAAGRLRKEFQDGDFITVGVKAVKSGTKSRKLAVSVEHTTIEREHGTQQPQLDFEDIQTKVPSQTSGSVGTGRQKETLNQIPIHVEQRRLKQQVSYDSKYRPVPAGCVTRGNNGGRGTIGSPVYDNQIDNIAFLTAGHVVKPIYVFNQPSPSTNGSKIGTDSRYVDNGSKDIGLIDASAVSKTYRLAGGSGGYGDDIIGILSDDRINDLLGSNGVLRQQGSSTGNQSGELTKADDTRLQLDTSPKSGDSGGPFYEIQSDGLYVAGIFAWGVDTDNDDEYSDAARGTRMTTTESTLNVRLS